MLTLSLVLASTALAGPAPVSIRSIEEPIRIDGVLDESAWSLAEPVTDFQQFVPRRGGPPPGSTEVRFLQDEDQLYVSVTVRGIDYPLRARYSAREQINDDDQIGLYLDTFGDQRSGYIFYFNALGIQQDIRYADGRWNPNWSTVYQSRGTVQDDGFTLEIAIPFRSIQYPEGGGPQDWGVMVTRKIPSRGSKFSFPVQERGNPVLFSQAAPLLGVRPPEEGAGSAWMPVLAVQQEGSRAAEGDPLSWSGLDPWQDSIRPGLDARFNLGPSNRVATTLNPDFSQIEADVTQLDLNQRFAFYYPEQRPFFVDGIDQFQDQASTLYTRSVVAPIYGAKLSRQTASSSLGLLHALDWTPGASVHEHGSPGFSEEELEGQWASTSFLRGRSNLKRQGSYLGWVAGDKTLQSGARNDLLGADFAMPLTERWMLQTFAQGSYLQDASGDPLMGHNTKLSLSSATSEGWMGHLRVQDLGDDFRNELGFLNQSGLTTADTELGYSFESEGLMDSWTPSLGAAGTRERDGDQNAHLRYEQRFVLGGLHNINSELFATQLRQDGVDFSGWSGELRYSGAPLRWLRLRLEGSMGTELDYGELLPAESRRTEFNVTLRPGASLRLDTRSAYEWFTPEGQEQQTGYTLWSRLYWQLHREFGLRLIAQTSGTSDDPSSELASSYLLTWMRHPGTEAYLGATQVIDWEQGGVMEQVLFAKLSWWFQT